MSECFHTVMKLKFTLVLRTTTHAAVIKSQSGCLLHKQIAYDYSNLPSSDSIKTSFNQATPIHTQFQTKLSLSPSLCHVSLLPPCCSSAPFCSVCTPFTHHDVSTVCKRGSKEGKLFDPQPRWHQHRRHIAFYCLYAGPIRKHLEGLFSELCPHSWVDKI